MVTMKNLQTSCRGPHVLRPHFSFCVARSNKHKQERRLCVPLLCFLAGNVRKSYFFPLKAAARYEKFAGKTRLLQLAYWLDVKFSIKKEIFKQRNPTCLCPNYPKKCSFRMCNKRVRILFYCVGLLAFCFEAREKSEGCVSDSSLDQTSHLRISRAGDKKKKRKTNKVMPEHMYVFAHKDSSNNLSKLWFRQKLLQNP